ASSHYRDFHAVDRWKRVKQAVPFFAAVSSDPELSGRGSKVEGRGLKLVDVHGVALDGEEALLLGQPLSEALPGIAAILTAPDRRRAARTGARHRLERHQVDRVGVVRMDDDREAEIGR